MTVQITIDVPNQLGRELARFQDRLPEVLEQGLRAIAAEEFEVYRDESEIIAILASQPSTETLLAIAPSPAVQRRMSDLLVRSKARGLDRDEEVELERYLMLEHLVRLAKAHALAQLQRRE